jgi:hypothetical protein
MEDYFSRHAAPVYPGYLVGIRAMTITASGYIHSPQQHFVWNPTNTNVAGCINYNDGGLLVRRQVRVGHMGKAYTEKGLVDHKVAMQECSCGFYAYFTQKRAYTYLPVGGVFAIVKAYGRLTYGDQGFRSEKMEILALAYDDEDTLAAYEEKPGEPKMPSMRLLWFGMFAAVFLLVFGLVLTFTTVLPFPIPTLICWSGTVVMAVVGKVHKRRWRNYTKASNGYHSMQMAFMADIRRQFPHTFQPDEYAMQRIRSRYPDLPVYTSVEEALADFELTDPNTITK